MTHKLNKKDTYKIVDNKGKIYFRCRIKKNAKDEVNRLNGLHGKGKYFIKET